MEERSNVVQEKDVSVVTLTWNSEKDIEKFLESLIIDFESSQINYEIIIIDNGSIDKTKENIKKINEKNGNIILIELGHNAGTTFSRNIGLRLAKGK